MRDREIRSFHIGYIGGTVDSEAGIASYPEIYRAVIDQRTFEIVMQSNLLSNQYTVTITEYWTRNAVLGRDREEELARFQVEGRFAAFREIVTTLVTAVWTGTWPTDPYLP